MNQYYLKIPALMLSMLVGTVACVKPPTITKGQVMQERLDNRLEKWKRSMENNCIRRVMDDASNIADSILLANARLERDTSDIPDIPGRPSRPEFTPPEDSTPVKPLLENIAEEDSLKKE